MLASSFFIFLDVYDSAVPRDTDHPGGAGQDLWIVPAHGIEFPSALYESNPGIGHFCRSVSKGASINIFWI